MDQILNIYWQGANEEGNAYVAFNETELSKAISGYDVNDLDIPYEQRQEAYDKLTKFKNNFTWSVDPQDGLSNGDEVSITVNYSKEMAKDLGISIEAKSGKAFTKTVEDLPEAVVIDAFANYTPEFEGMSPCASFKSTTVSMNGASDQETITVTSGTYYIMVNAHYIYYKDTYSFTTSYTPFKTNQSSTSTAKPKKASFKVSGKKGKAVISISTKATKYEIQYGKKKAMKNCKKKITTSSKVTLKKLSRKKTYYFRVRLINSSGKKGAWSAIKKVKIK